MRVIVFAAVLLAAYWAALVVGVDNPLVTHGAFLALITAPTVAVLARAALRRHDRLDGAVYGAALGLPDQQVGAAADAPPSAPYLSTVIVPARRTTRGGKL